MSWYQLTKQYQYQWDTDEGIAVATEGYGLFVCLWISGSHVWVHSQIPSHKNYNKSIEGTYEDHGVGYAAMVQDF